MWHFKVPLSYNTWTKVGTCEKTKPYIQFYFNLLYQEGTLKEIQCEIYLMCLLIKADRTFYTK